MQDSYVLVSTKIASDVILKVTAVKRLLASGECKRTNDAIEKVKISRSAYYKYKDYVFDYSDSCFEHIFTLFFELRDEAGVLSKILKIMADFGCNVLTINQNIPIRNVAAVTISARMEDFGKFSGLKEKISQTDGINKVELLAVQ